MTDERYQTLLKACAEEERRHAGVIFVDEKTIAPADISGLVRALSILAKETGAGTGLTEFAFCTADVLHWDGWHTARLSF